MVSEAGSAGDSSPLSLTVDTFTDAGGTPIFTIEEDGLLEIGDVSDAGDVTCDGASDATDSCPLPAPPPDTFYEPGCDVSDDSACNTVDALFILQCVSGIPNSFCPGN